MAQTVTPAQVYAQVVQQGGTQQQAEVAAALVDGIESNGQLNDQNPTSTASGLFQFLDTTWANYGGVSHAGNATFEQQVAKFISESAGNNFYAWAPDIGGSYNGSGNDTTIIPGSPVANKIASLNLANPLAGLSSMSAADQAAMQAALAAPGGQAYFQALATGAGGGGQSGAATGTPNLSAPAESVVIGGQTYTTLPGDQNASSQISSLGQMAATLSIYGFSGSDLQDLISWAWTEMTGNVDPSQIAIDIQTPGSPVYPIFEKQFPGFVPANQQLTAQGLQALSVQQYQQYQTFATQTAQAAGLPAGFINSNNIGTLVGNNVSQNELSARINNAMVLAYQSTPEQQQMFNSYFGTNYANDPFWGQNQASTANMTQADWTALQQANATPGGAAYLQAAQAAAHPSAPTPGQGLTPGQIAALALDPNVAEPLIAQEIQAAQIGGASVTAGVGAIDAATATKLAEAGITTEKATTTFQGIAPLSALETARPGMGGEAAQGTVSPEQLALGNLLGDPAAQRQQQTAIEVAKAPFAGGGGFVSNQKGVAGAGSGSNTGTGGT